MHRRRGIALLVVLASVMLMSSLILSAGALRTSARLDASTQLRLVESDDLLDSADTLIRTWLGRRSARATTPPGASTARVPVFDCRWSSDVARGSLLITAFDQAGMVPRSPVGQRSLDAAIPGDILRAVEGVDTTIDRFAWDVIGPGAYPYHAGQAVPATLLATHNPPRAAETPAPGVVNIATAPAPVLALLLRAEQRTGLDQILAARGDGRVPGVPSGSRAQRDLPRLVNVSPCWSFLVTVQSGGVQRDWWLTYRNAGSGWECVQRVLVPR